MKNLSRYDLLYKITSINYEGANVQIRFDTNYNMYWKMDTNSTISFGREKGYKRIIIFYFLGGRFGDICEYGFKFCV